MTCQTETATRLAAHRAFYEGRWQRSDRSAGSLRNLLVKKERFFLRRLRGRRGVLLDLGCGGGWRLLATVGPVAGVDVSQSSLRQAAQVYHGVVRADLAALPFTDGAFDLVVSLDVLGHVPSHLKDGVLREIRRVLKDGGQTLHYVEAEGQDPLNRFARRYPELYARHIVAPEGHVGLEPAGAVFRRFRAAGFVPLCEIAAYKGLVHLRRFVQCFDNGYRECSWLIRLLVGLGKALLRVPPLAIAADLALALALEAVDRLAPSDWAGGALVCYRKGEPSRSGGRRAPGGVPHDILPLDQPGQARAARPHAAEGVARHERDVAPVRRPGGRAAIEGAARQPGQGPASDL